MVELSTDTGINEVSEVTKFIIIEELDSTGRSFNFMVQRRFLGIWWTAPLGYAKKEYAQDAVNAICGKSIIHECVEIK